MIKVAITGNIASGKTLVQKILEEYKYKVLDTDILGHEVIKTSSELRDVFSEYEVFENDGSISRTKLGKLVFSDDELKNKLESISHPIIRNKILEFFAKNQSESAVFVAIPLLFEAGMQNLFDKIVLVYSDDEIRKQRLINRNNYSNDYANRRMMSQMPQERKIGLSDYIIYNNADIENLKSQVLKLCSLF